MTKPLREAADRQVQTPGDIPALPLTSTPQVAPVTAAADTARSKLTSPWASLFAVVLAFLWTLPTFGLLVTSLRPQREIGSSGWWTFFTDPQVTFENYETVLSTEGSSALGNAFINSFIITIPSVVIPIVLALLASYAFAWVDFKGRSLLFVLVIPIVAYNIRQLRAQESR